MIFAAACGLAASAAAVVALAALYGTRAAILASIVAVGAYIFGVIGAFRELGIE